MESLILEKAMAVRIAALMEKYRDSCFWFLNEDFIPQTVESALRAMQYLERYGDREAWQNAQEIKKCLLKTSS